MNHESQRHIWKQPKPVPRHEPTIPLNHRYKEKTMKFVEPGDRLHKFAVSDKCKLIHIMEPIEDEL